MISTTPPEKSRQLLARHEVWDDKAFEFLYLAVAWKEDSQIYTAHYENRMATFDSNPAALSELQKGTVLSYDLAYAAWRQDITEVMTPLPSNTFVKTPDYLDSIRVAKARPDQRRDQHLSKTPHPNICKYYGCIRDGAFITGICLQKHEFTLAEYVKGRDNQ